MSLCINPNCLNPDNPDNLPRCQSCGSELLLEGRYRVTHLLSDKGGFGKTFEVSDRNGILKVLKVLKKNTTKAVEQFQREAKVLRRLNHPGIPQGEDDFTFYPKNSQTPVYCLVMEKIEGENLHDWLENRNNRPINEKTAVDWLIQIANTLDELHQQQPPLIHRDIKPSNIMLKPDGYLVLIDFGIAREVTETYEQKKVAGQVTRVVTDGYSPLEQATGNAVTQSDFFALGRTFVHLLTGIHPFDILDQYNHDIYTDELECWQQKTSEISVILIDFIDKLMSRPIKNRPADTQEILQILKEIEKTLYPPRSSQSKSYKPESIVKVPKITLERTLGSFYSGHSNTISALVISPANLQTLISSSHDNTVKLWNLFSGEEILNLSVGDSYDIDSVALSPNGETLFIGTYEGEIKVHNLSTKEQIRTFKVDSSIVTSVAITPDGRTLVSGSYNGVKLWNLETGEYIRTLTTHFKAITSVTIHPDGNTVVSSGLDDGIQVWPKFTLTGHSEGVNCIDISSNGHILVSAGNDQRIIVWNLNNGEKIRTFSGYSKPINSVAISPDNKTLAIASNDETIKLINLNNGQEFYTFKAHLDGVSVVIFSPDGQFLISGGEDSTIKVWRIN